MGYVALAAVAIQAYGSIMKGKEDKAQADAQASAEQQDAKLQATKIRRMAADTKSQASAYYAASGVDVGQGSPLVTQREISQRSEEDALFTMLGGQNRASALRRQGSAAQTAGYINAAGSILSYGANSGSAWSRSPRSTTVAPGYVDSPSTFSTGRYA